ncbi:MAG: RidA family protein [Nitrososphaerales archaeon]
MSKKRASNPPTLPDPSGRYSHIVKVSAQNLLFIAGQVAFDKEGNIVGKGDMKAQTEQVFLNLKAALEAEGASFDDLVKLTVYTTDIKRYREEGTSIRNKFITKEPPTSTLLEISSLAHPDLLLEIEGIAALD